MNLPGERASRECFRDAVARLGLAASDEELDALWGMVRDLQEQMEICRRFLLEALGEASVADPLFGRGAHG